jgi:hypothetical protein
MSIFNVFVQITDLYSKYYHYFSKGGEGDEDKKRKLDSADEPDDDSHKKQAVVSQHLFSSNYHSFHSIGTRISL